jgi:hypothetical protein
MLKDTKEKNVVKDGGKAGDEGLLSIQPPMSISESVHQ